MYTQFSRQKRQPLVNIEDEASGIRQPSVNLTDGAADLLAAGVVAASVTAPLGDAPSSRRASGQNLSPRGGVIR